MRLDQIELAVVGLGYVGLPLAVAFGTKRSVTGFDISQARVSELQSGKDETGEISAQELAQATGLRLTSCLDDLRRCNCFIVAVPTPVDHQKKPDLTALLSASKSVGSILKKGDLVIYESTVYPGCTEDDCVPVLEQHSGLRFNQ
ncbi:MAG: Vi polysaccharide biosynthesis UDP-N-acetylglucosamine C-6 dehydrogenase TviB, partial [Betaproteobacteria bacterium]|nr:Vi polysaccharide biosynthesis UDP-N-acetylglucosamine C-6 dehydrogenase TviB [Betaproteobacteria bacterium]